jgi:EAL domain-containing protein (putative c-di-GMP-specific phosphodiesterase class I)
MTFFAANTDCSLIAEGIETPAELAMLQTLGVKYGQGYLLGRPFPVESVRGVQAGTRTFGKMFRRDKRWTDPARVA